MTWALALVLMLTAVASMITGAAVFAWAYRRVYEQTTYEAQHASHRATPAPVTTVVGGWTPTTTTDDYPSSVDEIADELDPTDHNPLPAADLEGTTTS